jgi:CubicO group peptidase (beta-lactamase class C family)
MLGQKGRYQGRQILKPASVAAMLSDNCGKVATDALGKLVGVDKNGYGLGLGIFPAPGGGFRYGWAGLAGGDAWTDPGRGLSAVIMIHVFHPIWAVKFAETVYKALDEN